jgi:hypothetical protein
MRPSRRQASPTTSASDYVRAFTIPGVGTPHFIFSLSFGSQGKFVILVSSVLFLRLPPSSEDTIHTRDVSFTCLHTSLFAF